METKPVIIQSYAILYRARDLPESTHKLIGAWVMHHRLFDTLEEAHVAAGLFFDDAALEHVFVQVVSPT